MLFDDYCLSPDEEDASSDEYDNSGGYDVSPDEWHIPSIKSISSGEDAPLHQVYSAPLDDLRGQTIDLTPYFNDERFRFISCTSFVDKHTLSLYETESLPHDRYNAISYVWLGLEALAAELEFDGSFRVYCGEGRDGTPREDGGPISMRVLRCACYYSLERNIDLLWLDRLCIKQTSREDKAWQIIRMFDVYRVCRQCLVLPGGLQRLASVYEQTLWTERAWTFQEVLAGGVDKVVVFAQDPPATRLPGVFYHTLTEGAGECCDLSSLVDVSLHLHMESGTDVPPNNLQRRLPVLLGPTQKDLEHLRNTICLELGGMRDPALIFLTSQLILHAIAKRDSSHPIDMVLSIIGLLGVERHFAARTRKFRGSQRLAATLALVEAVFRTHVSSDCRPKRVTCMSLDVPLWKTLEERCTSQPGDRAPLTLEQLAVLFDGGDDDVEGSPTEMHGWRAVPLGQFDAKPVDVDSTYRNLEKRAKNVVNKISLDIQARVYREKQAVQIVDEDEGSVELRPNLDLAPQNSGEPKCGDSVIFGWCLKLEASYYMRVFRFGLPGDVTNADS